MMNHRFQGRVTRQAHKGIPEGLYEEEQGRQGFWASKSSVPFSSFNSMDQYRGAFEAAYV